MAAFLCVIYSFSNMLILFMWLFAWFFKTMFWGSFQICIPISTSLILIVILPQSMDVYLFDSSWDKRYKDYCLQNHCSVWEVTYHQDCGSSSWSLPASTLHPLAFSLPPTTPKLNLNVTVPLHFFLLSTYYIFMYAEILLHNVFCMSPNFI